MKNTISKNLIFALIIGTTTVLPAFSLAQVPPSSGGSNTGGDTTVTTPVVPTVSGGSTGGDTTLTTPAIVPPVSGGDTGGDTTVTTPVVPTVSGGSTGGDTTLTTPSTSNNNGGGSSNSSSGSFSSGGSSSSGGYAIGSVNTVNPATFLTCPLLTSYLQFSSSNNDSKQVLKLQAFLNTQGFPTTITGTFDIQTESAVKAFQTKYISNIMGPWKATAPSGYVYITTIKEINKLACNSSLKLSASELAIINAYIANQNASTSTTGTTIGSTSNDGTITSTTSPLIGAIIDNSANTASVINTNIFQRIWNFITSIF